MNKNLLIVVIAILIIVGIALCAYMIINTNDVPSVDAGTTLAVVGEGSVSAVPDTATLNIGVTTIGDTASNAQSQNSADMDNVISALKAMGIADEDITTASYSIYPQYDYTTSVGVIVGYEVYNTLSVVLHDINTVGDVLGAATAAGANTAGSIDFSSSKADELYNQALTEAYAAAKEKGQAMADAAGMKIKGLVSLSEGADYSAVYAKTTMSYASADASVPIQTGQLTFTANVTAVYSVK